MPLFLPFVESIFDENFYEGEMEEFEASKFRITVVREQALLFPRCAIGQKDLFSMAGQYTKAMEALPGGIRRISVTLRTGSQFRKEKIFLFFMAIHIGY
jgi:hypothetical protein